jgi:hypothetical protein
MFARRRALRVSPAASRSRLADVRVSPPPSTRRSR